jgi:hypothetical protein
MVAQNFSKTKRRMVYAICAFFTVAELWSGSTHDKSSGKYLIILGFLNKSLLSLLQSLGLMIVT